MTRYYELPVPATVSKLLSDVLGKSANAFPGSRYPVGPRTPGSIGIYLTEKDRPGVVVFADNALTCSAGGAFSQLPLNIVEEGIKSGDVPGAMLDNFREVLDGARSMFERDGAPKLKLDSVKPVLGNTSRGLLTMLLKSKHRLDLNVEISGYPKGRMVICVS